MFIEGVCGILLFFLMRSVSVLMSFKAVDTIGGICATKEEPALVGTEEAVALCSGVPFNRRVKRLCGLLRAR